MLIPSIDLKDHAVVQLVQGERLAIKDPHIIRWIRKFEKFPKVQVIDLDAAMGTGNNLDLVRWIAGSLSCRVGGGIRTVARARLVLEAGAQQVIAGSALFKNGAPDLEFARTLAEAVGRERVIAAVDSRGGQVVIQAQRIKLDHLLVEQGFAPSKTEAQRHLKKGDVYVDGAPPQGFHLELVRGKKHLIKLGRKMKEIVVE